MMRMRNRPRGCRAGDVAWSSRKLAARDGAGRRVDRTFRPDYKPARRALKPDDAQVAQLVEHATENRSVGGSIPPLGTISSFAGIRHPPRPSENPL